MFVGRWYTCAACYRIWHWNLPVVHLCIHCFLWHYFCFIFLFNGIDIAGGMIRYASMLIYIYALLTTAILKGLTLRNLCLMFVCTCFI